MSNVVQFLESMGKNPAWLPSMDYTDAVAALDIDSAERQALLARDHAALSDLLGGRKMMMCVLFPADDDEQKQDEPKDDDEPDSEESISWHN